MRPPEFWDHRVGRASAPLLRAGLAPLSWLITAAGRWRWRRATPAKAPVPVICIGNVTLGGTGKTPLALALAALLQAQGHRPVFLSRGHGGRARGPLVVDPDRHDAALVGDEALLLAAAAPAIIARDRVAGARLAAAQNADLIIMDDGFQNPALHKDASLLVLDTQAGLGNGRVFPAGPLREPLADALARADALVAMGTGPCRSIPPCRCCAPVWSTRPRRRRGRCSPLPALAARKRSLMPCRPPGRTLCRPWHLPTITATAPVNCAPCAPGQRRKTPA